MAKPDRAAFARKNAGWLALAFGVILIYGLLQQNTFAAAAGAGGLLWIAISIWKRK